MKNGGMEDNQIVQSLQQRGVSPREINDALNQAQIKKAVMGGDNQDNTQMQPSIMQTPLPEYGSGEGEQNQGFYAPQTQEVSPQGYSSPAAGGYSQQNYESYAPYNPSSGGMDTETMIEIAEQVFAEKISNIQRQLQELNEMKSLTQARIENVSIRLRKIETIIDKLQITILEKIGSYGQDLGSIKKEMSMIEESFSNIIPSARKHEEISYLPKKTEKKSQGRISKK